MKLLMGLGKLVLWMIIILLRVFEGKVVEMFVVSRVEIMFFMLDDVDGSR